MARAGSIIARVVPFPPKSSSRLPPQRLPFVFPVTAAANLRIKSHSVSQWLPPLPPSPPMPPGPLTPPPTLVNPRRRKSCSTHSRPLPSTTQGKSSGCCCMTRSMTLLLSWTRCVVPSCSLGRNGYGVMQLQGIGRGRVVEVV